MAVRARRNYQSRHANCSALPLCGFALLVWAQYGCFVMGLWVCSEQCVVFEAQSYIMLRNYSEWKMHLANGQRHIKISADKLEIIHVSLLNVQRNVSMRFRKQKVSIRQEMKAPDLKIWDTCKAPKSRLVFDAKEINTDYTEHQI